MYHRFFFILLLSTLFVNYLLATLCHELKYYTNYTISLVFTSILAWRFKAVLDKQDLIQIFKKDYIILAPLDKQTKLSVRQDYHGFIIMNKPHIIQSL